MSVTVVSTSAVGGRCRAARALLALLALSISAPSVDAFYSYNATDRFRSKLLNMVRELWMDGNNRMLRIELIKREYGHNEDFAMAQELTNIIAMKDQMADLFNQVAMSNSTIDVWNTIPILLREHRMKTHVENYVQSIKEYTKLDPSTRRMQRSRGTLKQHYEREYNVSIDKLFFDESDVHQMYDDLSTMIEEKKL